METVDCMPAQRRDVTVAGDRAYLDYKVEVDNVTESEWSSLLDQFDDANIYQTWAYGAVRWQEKNLSHLILKQGGQIVAIAQLRIMRPARLPFGIAYLRWGPLFQKRGRELSPEILHAIARALRDEYVTRRGLYLEILPNAFSGSLRAKAFRLAFSSFDHQPGISDEQYRTLVLDLSPQLDILRKSLDKKWRNQLNAAERNALEVIQGESSELYHEFSGLYVQMWQRKRFESLVSVEEFLQIHERLFENQRLRILVCRQQGKPVSGLVCSAMGGTGIYLLGATNEEGMKSKGSYLLQWTAIRWLKESGIAQYDLGGIDPGANPGVHHFKSGMSGADVSHMDAFIACSNRFIGTLVRVGSLLRKRRRPARVAIATR